MVPLISCCLFREHLVVLCYDKHVQAFCVTVRRAWGTVLGSMTSSGNTPEAGTGVVASAHRECVRKQGRYSVCDCVIV